jgi:DNA-binding PadR family transcriptional regulator
VTTFVLTAPTCGDRRRFRFMTSDRARGHRRRRQHPFPGVGFGPGPGFGGRKARRGDIRAAILVLLGEEPMHGYQMIQEIAARTDGVWTPSPGSVYPTLQQLEDEELVRPTASDTGKRVFELTDAGRAAAATTTAPWTEATAESEDALVALRDLAISVMAATRQVAAAGSPDQLDAAQGVLRDARKQLYRILAEDE